MSNKVIIKLQYLNHAWKAALALCITATIAIYFDYNFFWWAVFTTFVSIQLNIGTSIKVGISRLIGTILGVMASMVISLFYQFPLVYYPLMFIFIGFVVYHLTNPNYMMAALLCLFATMAILLFGPNLSGGITHYAIERCLQIILALAVASLVLMVLRFQYAHKILRSHLGNTFYRMEKLLNTVILPYVTSIKTKRYQLRQIFSSVNADLIKAHELLDAAHYEWHKENFQEGQCLELLNLSRRLTAVLASLYAVSRYIPTESLIPTQQKQLNEILSAITATIRDISRMIVNISQNDLLASQKQLINYHQLLSDQITKITQRIQQDQHVDLNLLAFLGLLHRLSILLDNTKSIVLAMNTGQINSRLQKQLREEAQWISGVKPIPKKIDPIRVRHGIHVGLTLAIITFFQQYFQWSVFIPIIGTLSAVMAVISTIKPAFGNLGWGILGALSGTAYAWLALHALNHYPHFFSVIAALFIGTMIASYFYVWSQAEGKQFIVFAVFFSLVITILFLASPSQRGNLDQGLLVAIGIFLGAVLISIISRVILPCDYLSEYYQVASRGLKETAVALAFISKLPTGNVSSQQFQHHVYIVNHDIDYTKHLTTLIYDQGRFNDKAQQAARALATTNRLLIYASLFFYINYNRLNNCTMVHELMSNLTTLLNTVHQYYMACAQALADRHYIVPAPDYRQLIHTLNYQASLIIKKISPEMQLEQQTDFVIFAQMINSLRRIVDVLPLIAKQLKNLLKEVK